MLSLADVKGKVDFGIITIRHDEYTAMLRHMPKSQVINGTRYYEYAELPTSTDTKCGVAVTRALEQGNGDSFAVACDLIDDLNPTWILVVGIAGGYPDEDFSLGDVLLASRIYDVTVSAAVMDGDTHAREWNPTGGPVHHEVEKLLGAIPGWAKTKMRGWNNKSKLTKSRPKCELPENAECPRLSGPLKLKEAILKSLSHHFPQEGKHRPPLYNVASVASGNTLVKDPEIAAEWKICARSMRFVEMEAAGVYRAARRGGRNIPVLIVRGLSDIIGLKRDGVWTEFACFSAAAFTAALISSGMCNLERQKIEQLPPAASTRAQQEAEAKARLADEMSRLTFAELQVVTKHLARHRAEAGVNFTVSNPDDKIAKNGLSADIREKLVLGLSKVRLVQDYVTGVAKVDPHFPNELTGGFMKAYREFSESGYQGDELFGKLADLACYPSVEGKHEAAGLAILTYLFEKCLVFKQ